MVAGRARATPTAVGILAGTRCIPVCCGRQRPWHCLSLAGGALSAARSAEGKPAPEKNALSRAPQATGYA